MNTYIAFLRGVNVGGHHLMPMAQLCSHLKTKGLTCVKSYLQSGNLIITSEEARKKVLQQLIQHSIQEKFGLDIPVLLFEPKEITAILNRNPFAQEEPKQQYFCLLQSLPNPNMLANLNPLEYPNDGFEVIDNCVHLCYKNGAGKAKLTNNVIERKLGVKATTRNLNTISKIQNLLSSSLAQ